MWVWVPQVRFSVGGLRCPADITLSTSHSSTYNTNQHSKNKSHGIFLHITGTSVQRNHLSARVCQAPSPFRVLVIWNGISYSLKWRCHPFEEKISLATSKVVKITSGAVSEWLSLTAFLGTVDIRVHVVHTSRVIIAYALEPLSSLTQIKQSTGHN